MRRDQLNYELPPHLIAQQPAANRSDSRLMILDRSSGTIRHQRFSDIIDELADGDLLVLNNTKVKPVRLHGHRRGTGGIVELFLLIELPDGSYRAMTKSGGRLQVGEVIEIRETDDSRAEMRLRATLGLKSDDGAWTVEFESPQGLDVPSELHRLAQMPLPPYIQREKFSDPSDAHDRERYQTVFAQHDGAVAAPTAGLHFTKELLDTLEAMGVRKAEVTLHVGAGTFKPVKCEKVEDHPMHTEQFELTLPSSQAVNEVAASDKRVVALGTTSVRVLESCATAEGIVKAQVGETDLMILPGYEFRVVDALITNFHLPYSTLMALVMAFAGEEFILEAYREAVANEYRFLSYGDAMLIL